MFNKLITIGTFDIPHVGHAAFLAECGEHAEEVVVGVNSDRFTQFYRDEAPLYNQKERMTLIQGLGYHVVLNDGQGGGLIKKWSPDVVAIGSDWLVKDYLNQIGLDEEYFRSTGTAMLFLPYTPGISSSDIKERLRVRN